MKKLNCFLMVLFWGHLLFGQSINPIFTFLGDVPLDTEQQLRYDKFVNAEGVDSVKIISVSPLVPTHDRGKVKISIPNNSCGDRDYLPKSVSYESDGDYIWSGAMKYLPEVEACNCGSGELVMVSKNGHKFGSFSLGGQAYEYWDLTGGKQALLYMSEDTETRADCLDTGSGSSLPSVAKTTTCTVKVLVLYNDYAQNMWADIPDKAELAVAQCNSAYRNSDVSECDLEMVLIGVKHFDFDQTSNPKEDVDSLCGSPIAQNLRLLYQADMVVLLGKKYPGAFGIAGSLTLAPDSTYAIVSIFSATRSGRWTFAHETGHLFGGLHNIGPASDSAKGMVFISQQFCSKMTIMAQLGGQGIAPSRILHYSNPNVTWHDVETGTPINNVARQLRNAGCVVGNFIEDAPSLDILLMGNSKVCPCKNAYFTAQISGGTQPYSGYWQYSTDGINWLPSNPVAGTCGVNIAYATQLGCDHLDYKFARVTVFEANGLSVSRTRYVEVDENLNCPLRLIEAEDRIKTYPNPSSGDIIVEVSAAESGEAVYQILDLQGKDIINGIQFLAKGGNEIHIASGLLTSGIFILRIQMNDEIYTQQIILD